jgi:type I restriction enzyme M protein
MTDTRTPIEDNDIPDLLARWTNREEGEKSFRVPASEIAKNGYELMPARYKAQKIQIVTHDSPAQVIDDILKVEDEIQARLKALREQVHV